MEDIHIVVGLRAKPGKEKELRRDLAAVVEPSRADEGNLGYDLFEDETDPGVFVFVEHWSSADAQHRHHTEAAHISRFHAGGAANVKATLFSHVLKRVM